jgi:hypothetical protein
MDSGQCVRKETAGEEISILCNSVSQKAHELLKVVQEKLNPLYLSTPTCTENVKPQEARLYPAYFDGLRANLQSALSALKETEHTINRIDL